MAEGKAGKKEMQKAAMTAVMRVVETAELRVGWWAVS